MRRACLVLRMPARSLFCFRITVAPLLPQQDCDLSTLINADPSNAKFDLLESHAQFIVYQILRGLKVRLISPLAPLTHQKHSLFIHPRCSISTRRAFSIAISSRKTS